MKKILFSLIAVVALTACNNDEDFAPVNSSDEIRVNATIGEMTRVATDGMASHFENGDQIMVYGWTGDKTTVPANPAIASVNTLTIENDVETWEAQPQMLWQSQTAAHYFIGLYPVCTVTNFSADAYLLDETKQEDADLLVAVSDDQGIVANNRGVDLTFKHVMAKININMNFRNQWDATPAPSEVKLYCGKEAAVNYLLQTVTADAYVFDAKKYIAMPVLGTPVTGFDKSYSSIVVPQTGVNIVDILINGTTYRYEGVEDIPFESGKVTTLNLNVGKDNITLGGVTVGDWANGTTIPGGEAEEVIQYTTNTEGNVTTYTVYTAEGLQEVNALVRSNLSHNITLAADITLPAPADGGSNWTPIGNNPNNYTGTFDGAGHTIKGLVINSSAKYQGLIGELGDDNGTVKNLTIEGCTITGTRCIGGIAGSNGGTIENCTVRGSSGHPVSITGSDNYIGGIVGINGGGTVIGCRMLADGGTVTIESNQNKVGGIAGSNEASSILIACFVKGANVTASSQCGGIAGYNTTDGTLTGCYAYQCTKGSTKEALDGYENVLGMIFKETSTVNACYFYVSGGTGENVTPVSGKGSSTTSGADALVVGTAEGWGNSTSGAVKAMNDAISTAGYTWQWGGTVENPTLKK